MLTFTTFLLVALTLNNSNLQDTTPPTGKQIAIIPAKTLQRYDNQKSYKFQIENEDYCEKLRGSMYEDSLALEQGKDTLPNDFLLMSQKTAAKNIKNSLQNFKSNGCYEDKSIPAIDRDLFKELDSKLKNNK